MIFLVAGHFYWVSVAECTAETKIWSRCQPRGELHRGRCQVKTTN